MLLLRKTFIQITSYTTGRFVPTRPEMTIEIYFSKNK